MSHPSQPDPRAGLSPLVPGTAPVFGNRRIHFHLGAHKTATTFIQNNLKKNNPELLEEGVLYMPLGEFRTKGLTKSISDVVKSNRRSDQLPGLRQDILNAFDPELVEKCHTIIISEENFSAMPSTFLEPGAYSRLHQELKYLREELGANLHVFFSIRAYPDFLSSVYVEILRHQAYVDYGTFLSALYDDAPSLWTTAYRSLTSLLGADNVTIWDFKDTVKFPQEVLRMLSGIAMDFEIDPAPVRESLSQRAVEFLRDFYRLPGGQLPANIVAKVANRINPLTKNQSKFDPWTPRERLYLREIYEAEKANLPMRQFGK